jgi:hypothetical protein
LGLPSIHYETSKHNRVQVKQEPCYRSIEADGTDQLGTLRYVSPLNKSEPARDISAGIAKKVVRGWTKRNHNKY